MFDCFRMMQGLFSHGTPKGGLAQFFALVSNHGSVVAALALFDGWIFTMSWGGVFPAPPQMEALGVMSEGVWAISLVTCTIVLGVCMIFLRPSPRPRLSGLMLCAGALSCGVVLSALSSACPEASSVFFVVSGLMCGVGSGIATALWGGVISRYDSSVVLKLLVASLVASALIEIIFASVPKVVAYAGMAVIPFAMAALLYRASIQDGNRRFAGGASVSVLPSAPKAVSGMALFMVLAMVFGMSAGLVRVLLGVDAHLEGDALAFGAAVLLASGVLLVSRVPEDGGSFALFYRAIAFIAAAFILLTTAVRHISHGALLAFGIHTVGFVYFYGLLWVFCSIYTQRGGRSSRIFIGGFFANQVGQIVGAAIGDSLSLAWGPQSIAASASNAMVYLLLFASVALLARMSDDGMASGGFPMATEGAMEEACRAASRSRGLTPRESEILPYLVKGYDRGYIAECLTVSAETVKSHVRRIYEKLGVHSRVELFNAVASYAGHGGTGDEGGLVE